MFLVLVAVRGWERARAIDVRICCFTAGVRGPGIDFDLRVDTV
jgi:hypothetical protein